MPSSPNKHLRECRENLDRVLIRGLPRFGSLRYNDVVREALLRYDVTQGFVEKYIKQFYIDEGLVILKDDVLYPMQKEEKVST